MTDKILEVRSGTLRAYSKAIADLSKQLEKALDDLWQCQARVRELEAQIKAAGHEPHL